MWLDGFHCTGAYLDNSRDDQSWRESWIKLQSPFCRQSFGYAACPECRHWINIGKYRRFFIRVKLWLKNET